MAFFGLLIDIIIIGFFVGCIMVALTFIVGGLAGVVAMLVLLKDSFKNLP